MKGTENSFSAPPQVVWDVTRGQTVPPKVATATGRDWDIDARPINATEAVAVIALVILADATIFRSHGYAGFAALLLLAPPLILLGSAHLHRMPAMWLVGGLLLLLAARSIWLGSALTTVTGVVLLIAFSMTIHGQPPYVLDILAHSFRTLAGGVKGWVQCAVAARRAAPHMPRRRWLSVTLPLAVLTLFSTLFVLANPDLVKTFSETLQQFSSWLSSVIENITFNWLELGFCVIAAWIAMGFLRPLIDNRVSKLADAKKVLTGNGSPHESSLYSAIRNTLLAVIGLFAVYLVFEFATLWCRKFPVGFYYAGYAHQGAAWLTAALALATLVLSLIFRGSIVEDPRLLRLRRLAWIWSLENFLLAVSVFNRMHIYVDFNGMTRMRTIGVFGISSVIVGFVLVLWKIMHNRDFVWLLQRQLWTVAIATIMFALLPLDMLVHAYNVRQILAGDLAPSVQISVHPMSAEGVLVLPPLVHVENSEIREGIRALLAQRAIDAERREAQRQLQGWTAVQLADSRLLTILRAERAVWVKYLDDTQREATLNRFHAYVYQWY